MRTLRIVCVIIFYFPGILIASVKLHMKYPNAKREFINAKLTTYIEDNLPLD